MDKLILSNREVWESLQISRTTFYNLVKQGRIPHLRLGHKILVPRGALARLLAEAGEAGERQPDA